MFARLTMRLVEDERHNLDSCGSVLVETLNYDRTCVDLIARAPSRLDLYFIVHERGQTKNLIFDIDRSTNV